MAQSASTGIGSTKSIGGLHNPWIKTELLRSVAKGVGDGPPSLAAFAQVLDLRAVENGAAGHCVLSDTSHSVGAVLVPECVKQWKASMPGATLSQLNGATVLVRAFRVALNAQKGHFLLHLHELRFIERRACVAGGLASGAPVSVMEDLAVVAAFQAACQIALAPPPAAPAPAPPPAAAPAPAPAPAAAPSGSYLQRAALERQRSAAAAAAAAVANAEAGATASPPGATATPPEPEASHESGGGDDDADEFAGASQVWAPYDASQDDGDGDGDGDDDGLGPLTQAPLSQPPPMTQGASQWAASQASQLPSPPSPGGDGGEPLTQAPLPSPPPMTQGASQWAAGGSAWEDEGQNGMESAFSQPSGDGAANGGGAPMEVEEEEDEDDDGGDFDPSDPLDLKSVDPWEVARQCLPPLPAHVLAPT